MRERERERGALQFFNFPYHSVLFFIQVMDSWRAKHYQQAKLSSRKAKELALTALVCGGINVVILVTLSLICTLVSLGVLEYFT